ncbi:MAG: polyphosphate polymerase domain-containing protein [Rhodobacteraceae bacterium]|nr:polyphosphate polymerase domain-containing protein [Paracoccaceae bacterium]
MSIHDPNLDLDWLISDFSPISLQELNETAEMLSRIDNKYVVPRAALQSLVPALQGEFRILDIDQRRAFTYDTRYFDDAERSAYFEHHQGLRKGFKVRVRRYADAGLSFLEVKVKGKRGMTEKFRLPQDAEPVEQLSDEAMRFARHTYCGQYEKPFEYDLKAAMDIRYKRITLVAKTGGERMTIDTDLRFQTKNGTMSLGTDVFIVEAKSALGRGFADAQLRRAKQRPTKKCSKYCIAMAAMGEVDRYNRFLPTMRKLGLIASGRPGGGCSEIRPELRLNVAAPGHLSGRRAA